MIAQRYVWLLRDVATCFDYIPHEDSVCRVCRVQEKGVVRVPRTELERHLAHHRQEKVAPREKLDDFLEATA